MPVHFQSAPDPTDLTPLTAGTDHYRRKPDFWTETLPAAFRQENLFIAGLDAARMMNAEYEDEEGFYALDPKLLEGTLFEQDTSLLPLLRDVNSRKHFDAIHEKVRQEYADRGVLERSGGLGFLAAMAGGVLSPDVLIPGFGVARAGGHQLLRTAGRTAAAAVTGASVAEGVLHQTQYTRTKLESAFALTGAGLFGAALGGFAHAIPAAARARMGKELDRTLDYAGIDPEDIGPDGRLRIRAEDIDEVDDGITLPRPEDDLNEPQTSFFSRIAAALAPEELTANAAKAIDKVRNLSWRGAVQAHARQAKIRKIREAMAKGDERLYEVADRFERGEADLDELLRAAEAAEEANAPQLVKRSERVTRQVEHDDGAPLQTPEQAADPDYVPPGAIPPAPLSKAMKAAIDKFNEEYAARKGIRKRTPGGEDQVEPEGPYEDLPESRKQELQQRWFDQEPVKGGSGERPARARDVQDTPGIGDATAKALREQGIFTLADLYEAIKANKLRPFKGVGWKKIDAWERHLDTISDLRDKPWDLQGHDVDPAVVVWDRIKAWGTQAGQAIRDIAPEDLLATWFRGLDSDTARQIAAHLVENSAMAHKVLIEGEVPDNWVVTVLDEIRDAPTPREAIIDPATDSVERLAAMKAAGRSSKTARRRLRDLTVPEPNAAAGFGIPLRNDEAVSAAIDEAATKVDKEAAAWQSIVVKNAEDLDEAEWRLVESAATTKEMAEEARTLSVEARLNQAQGHLQRLKRRRDLFHVERQVRVHRYRALQKQAERGTGEADKSDLLERLVIPHLRTEGGRPAAFGQDPTKPLNRLPSDRQVTLVRADDPRAVQLTTRPGAARGVRVVVAETQRTSDGRTTFQPSAKNNWGAGTILAIHKTGGEAGPGPSSKAVIAAQQRLDSLRTSMRSLATAEQIEQIAGAKLGHKAERGELMNLGLDDSDIDLLHEQLSAAGQKLKSAHAALMAAQEEAAKARPREKASYTVEVVLDSPTTSTLEIEILRRINRGEFLLDQMKDKRSPQARRYQARIQQLWKAWGEEQTRLGIHRPTKEYTPKGKDAPRDEEGNIIKKPPQERQKIAPAGVQEGAVVFVPLKDLDIQLDKGTRRPLRDSPEVLEHVRRARMPIREGDLGSIGDSGDVTSEKGPPSVVRSKYRDAAEIRERTGAETSAGREPTVGPGGETGLYVLPAQWRRIIGREVDLPPDPGKRYWRRETFSPEERAIAGKDTLETISGFVESEKARKDRPSQKPAFSSEPEDIIEFIPSEAEGGKPTHIHRYGAGEEVDRPMIAAASQTSSRAIDDPGLSLDPMMPRLRDAFQERVGQRTRLEMEGLLPTRTELIRDLEDDADRWLGLPLERDMHPDVRKLRDWGDKASALRLQAKHLRDAGLDLERAGWLEERADMLDDNPRELFAGEHGQDGPVITRDPHILQDTVDNKRNVGASRHGDDLDDYEYRQHLAEEMSDENETLSRKGEGLTGEEAETDPELAQRYFDMGPIEGGSGKGGRGLKPIDPNHTMARIANIAGLDPHSDMMQRMLRLNPALRLSVSPSSAVRQLAMWLMDTGLWYAKNLEGYANKASVADNIRLREAKLHEALESVPKAYYQYLQRMEGKPPKQDISIARARLTATLHSIQSKAFGAGDAIDYPTFLERIGQAMRRGDKDADIMEVAGVARELRREIFDPALAEFIGLGRLPAGLRSDLAPSYLTRLYNIRAIKEKPHEFLEMATEHFVGKHNMTVAKAKKAADQVMEGILAGPEGRIPYDAYEFRATRSAKSRVFDIDDETLMSKGFLDNNIETVLRFYFRSVIPDIELMKLDKAMYHTVEGGPKRKDYIPDPRLPRVLKRTEEYYNRMIDTAEDQGNKGLARKLEGKMARDMDDLNAVIGRLRNTYGIPNDPDSPLIRTGISLRAFNFIVDSGMFMLSSLPDVARPFMLFGTGRVFKHGLVPMVRDWQSFKINAKEARLAGAAGEWAMARRGLSMFDYGDLYYGRGTKFERGLRRFSQEMGIFSGLIPWNTMMKQWTGTIVSQNIAEDIATVMSGAVANPEVKLAMNRLAKGTISQDMIPRIHAELKKRPTAGKPGAELLDIGSDKWTDLQARDAFRIALARDVDLAIVTPGVGDKPLWMSKELGRFMGQYKSFAMAATTRMLLLGLQKPDLAFWNGVGMSVSLGMASLYLKSQAANWPTPDITTQKGFFWWLRNGIDRSGIWGILGDAHNSVGIATRGAISGGRIFGGVDPGFRYTSRNLLTEIAGPTASTIMDVGKTLEGFGSIAEGRAPSIGSRNAAKRLMPAQNHFMLSRIYDRTFKAGHRAMVSGLNLERNRTVAQKRRWRKSRQSQALQAEAVPHSSQVAKGQ